MRNLTVNVISVHYKYKADVRSYYFIDVLMSFLINAVIPTPEGTSSSQSETEWAGF